MLNDNHNKMNSYDMYESFNDDLKYDENLLGTDIRKLYSKDIEMFPLLSKKKEKELVNILCNSSKDSTEYKQAREILISSNLRLVVFIAKKFQNRGLSFMDLIQEGTIGLITAVDKFDNSKETRFSTYSTYWIVQKITKALAEKSRNIRLPYRAFLELNSYLKNVDKLAKKLNREPTNNEITYYLGYKKKEIERFEKLSNDTISLNQLINDEEFDELGSLVEYSDDNVEKKVINERIKEDIIYALLNNFDKRTAYVLIKRYGLDGEEPKTLEEVGKTIGKTYERVRQIEKNAINRIRKSKNLSNIFASFTDYPDKAIENAAKISNTKRSYNRKENIEEICNETIRLKSIYEYLECYTKEEIDKAIEKLPEEDKEIIRVRYGNDLKNSIQNSLVSDKRIIAKFYESVIPKIRKEIIDNRLNNEKMYNDKIKILKKVSIK